MAATGLFAWKMKPSDQDLTRFLRVKKQKVSRRPVTAQLAPEMLTQSGKGMCPESIHGQELTQVPITTSFHWTPEVTYNSRMTEDLMKDLKLSDLFPPMSDSTSNGLKDSLQYDFLLEGLLKEWRTRRQKLFNPGPELKPSNRSFFPHQHNQIKYWAWPFLGMMALTSSLPLMHSAKKPLVSTLQPYHVEVQLEVAPEDYERVAALPSSEMPLFEKFSYNPNETTTQPQTQFEQTMGLDLASNEVIVSAQHSEATLQHPMANFDYSKMILELFMKKAYCQSFRPEFGYPDSLAVTTSESESYFPLEPRNIDQVPLKEVPEFLNMVELEDVVFSRDCILPILCSQPFWGHPILNPSLYRELEKAAVYDYVQARVSTEADYIRSQRRSVQFASRPFDKSLRLAVSLNELNLFKHFATPNKARKVEKLTAEEDVQFWNASMDSKQWLKNLVLNSERMRDSLLSTAQPSENTPPTMIRLFAQDWPTLPTQFSRISKGSPKRTEIDTASFLTPLMDLQQPIETVIDIIQSPPIALVLHDTFAEVTTLLSRRLSTWLTDWMTTWSLMYSTTEGVLNDATFTNQFTQTLGKTQVQTNKWARPQMLQNPNYQALTGTDPVIASDFPEQFFRASLTYVNTKKLPASMPARSADYTHMLERNQGPLRFNLISKRGKEQKERLVKTLPHPTVGSLLKTFVFRSSSYLEDPYFDQNRKNVKRRRSSRYRRVGVAVKKRKRILPRPAWLRPLLYHPFLKLRHPEMSPRLQSGAGQSTTRQSAQIPSTLNSQRKLTHKYLPSEGPSLFRQNSLHHSLMIQLPQLTNEKYFQIAKWAEPKSKLKSWRAFLVNEFGPYKKRLSSNFNQLKQVTLNKRMTKINEMPQWFWKGSQSASDIEGLRFKQNLMDPLFTQNFASGAHLNSEATMSHFLLNELRLVARQNQAIYKRLNNAILLHRNKHGFMAASRPHLSNINRGRLLKRKNWVWPNGWSQVTLSPFNEIQSQWVLKESHLLRNSSVNDLQDWWSVNKVRKRNKAARESHQKGIFRLRLPFRSRKKVHPITVGRAWKKLNLVDQKLNVFGLIQNRTQLYPRQLKLRFQTEKGATQLSNLQLTPPEREVQKYISRSVAFWWNETENQLLSLVNPAGTHPWNLFEGLTAVPQLTSESQPLGITLINGSLILLHVALLSFLIQLPETRTLLKFYTLVINRIGSGYLWMAAMCYWLLQECVYEIQYALFCARILVIPPKDPRRFTYKMLAKQLHRAEYNPHINGRLVYRIPRTIHASNLKDITRSRKVIVPLIEMCIQRYYGLRYQQAVDLELKMEQDVNDAAPQLAEQLERIKVSPLELEQILDQDLDQDLELLNASGNGTGPATVDALWEELKREVKRRRREERARQEALEYQKQYDDYRQRERLAERARLEGLLEETSPSERIIMNREDIVTPIALTAIEEPSSEEEEDKELAQLFQMTPEEYQNSIVDSDELDESFLAEEAEDEDEDEEDGEFVYTGKAFVNLDELNKSFFGEDAEEEDKNKETDKETESASTEENEFNEERKKEEEERKKEERRLKEYHSEPEHYIDAAEQLLKLLKIPENPFVNTFRSNLKREPWWLYETLEESLTDLPPSLQNDELSIRLEKAKQEQTALYYGVLYLKERHKDYKQALPSDYFSVQKMYQRALHQSVFIKDVLRHKLYKGLVTFTKSVVGLYFLISRKYYRFYSAVDMAIATTRRLAAQFLEDPATNATQAFNNYFFLALESDLLVRRGDGSEALETLKVELYTRQMNAFGPLGNLAQRRLHRLADEAYIAWTKPDMDLLLRHQKSLIFWNMWGAVLIRAVSRYQLSMADLLSTKEEQEKLLEYLITESDWSWTQQPLLQVQPLADLFSLGKRTWNDFSLSTATKQLGDPPILEDVLHPRKGLTQAAQKQLTRLETFEKQNPADVLYADKHAMSLDELSWRWGAQQMNMYHSRMTALPIEYQPAGNLQAVPQIKYYYTMHTQLGWIIQDNLRTTFTNTPSKNALIIGPPGPEVTNLIRAVVGELEMKLITDNARRYTTVIRNVAIGVRHLKEVFYAVAVEAPCLFVLEDIHLIGRRRELLIAEDEELYLLERAQATPNNPEYERDHSIDKFEKHTLLHYEKPFRGDYSFLISTNCFAFDYFVEPAPSRMRRLGLFTESQYKLKAIEQELVKLRGLENLSNAQAKAPSLMVTSSLQARQPVKEVKAAPNSPLTVAIEKNKKAFRPRRIVKSMPLQGFSWDMWMLLSRYDYSIRSKVALLAVLTEDAVGELTDMITDLLVMMDTVRATRGVIMFATTHAPTSLDPALRRPGRLDETLKVPLFSSIDTRWEVLKLRLEDSDPLQELTPYGLVTRNLSNSKVSELAIQSTLAILPKKVSLAHTTNLSASPIKALKAQMHMSYLEAFVNSKGFDQLKDQMGDLIDVPSEKAAVETQMRQRKYQIQVNTLAYSLVGAHLIHWKAKVVTDQLEAEPLSYSVEKVHPLLGSVEQQNQYIQFTIARTRDPLVVREHVTNSLAPRFAETFFTSSLVNPSSVVGPDKDLASLQLTFQLRDKTNYVPLTFQDFELAATRFKPGGCSPFTPFFPAFRNNFVNLGVPASRTSDFISSVIQKRAIWTKNLVVYRLLYLPVNQDYREAYVLPMYEVTDPYKHYETLQKELRVLYRPGNLTMNEKFELHKNYRLFLALANRTVKDWHATPKREEGGLPKRDVLPSLEELKSLARVMNHPSGTHSYYRQTMHLRQRFHLIDQWWNGHLEDYDIETTLMSDVETRTFFEESIGNDVEIEYPQSEKYYNVRSRRWVWKRTAESWFLKGAKFTDAAAYHYMVCALTRCYEELHKNRESLDHLAYTFLKSGTVSELETFSHYTRFYQTDV